MFDYLKTSGIGPAEMMEAHFRPRLNLITGDNGLGKSLLLDVVWWAVSRYWPGDEMGRPISNHDKGTIEFGMYQTGNVFRFDRLSQKWRRLDADAAPPERFLVLHAQVDGSFSVWDELRKADNSRTPTEPENPPEYFRPEHIWNGLGVRCNGLIADWAGWQKEQGESFRQLCRVLEHLSPDADELLRPGPLMRVSLNDVRDIPSLAMPYGQNVPIIHASAAIKRILSLAYLLVWSWQEHQRACELLGATPASEMLFLIDEIESHLHPRWQRKIFRALLSVMQAMVQNSGVQVQIIATTHSPLVLASLEPLFDERQDTLFDFNMDSSSGNPVVQLRELPWRKRGESLNWLTSEHFGLASGRAVEAEQLLEEAATLLAQPHIHAADATELDARLRRTLADTDPFWTRWRYIGEKQRWLA